MARLRDRIVAHGPMLDHLLSTLQERDASVTLLFAGPSGIGKRLAARSLAQTVLCERRPADSLAAGACGECGSCRRVDAAAHEALLEVRPEGTQIKIDQARDVVEFLQLARIGRARVIIIDQAHLLNPQAANSLLKVLEEPPPGTFIILLAPTPAALLATLRSRSRTVLFRSLTNAEVKQVQGAAPEWAVRAARGSLERLHDLLDPEVQETRGAAALALENLLADERFLFRTDWREMVREKGAFPRILSFWTAFARDGLVLHAQDKESLMNPDQKSLLTRLGAEPRGLIEALAERFIRLEAETSSNRDPQLAVEQLFVDLRSLRGL